MSEFETSTEEATPDDGPDRGAEAAEASRPESPPRGLIEDLLPEDTAFGEEGADDGEPVEGVAAILAAVSSERDGYLDALKRLKAEFDNHRRRTTEQATQQRQQAATGLVEKLLPVLDSCDAALLHDAESIRPVMDALLEVLSTEGLERIHPLEVVFDPELHEAVIHEPGVEDEAPTVSEVLRTGYAWKGRVLRPAMVKVRG